MAYHTARYEQEKLAGIRRPSGAKNLQELTPLHRDVINLHAAGYSGNEIARLVRRSPAWVSTILNDPLVVEEIEGIKSQQQMRLKALMGEAVDTVASAMRNAPKQSERLKAADMVFKSNGAYATDDPSGNKDSAENIISSILEKAQIHIHTDGREERVVNDPSALEHKDDE